MIRAFHNRQRFSRLTLAEAATCRRSLASKTSLRFVGVALVVASVASTLAHRAVYEAAKQGPPQLAELGLGLSTFLLASAGMMLMLLGRLLFEPATGSRTSMRSAKRPMAPTEGQRRAHHTQHQAGTMHAVANDALPLAESRPITASTGQAGTYSRHVGRGLAF